MASHRLQDLGSLLEVWTLTITGEARDVRRRAGVSQATLARRIGVTAATLSRWEGASRLPRGAAGIRYGRQLRHLAKAYRG